MNSVKIKDKNYGYKYCFNENGYTFNGSNSAIFYFASFSQQGLTFRGRNSLLQPFRVVPKTGEQPIRGYSDKQRLFLFIARGHTKHRRDWNIRLKVGLESNVQRVLKVVSLCENGGKTIMEVYP